MAAKAPKYERIKTYLLQGIAGGSFTETVPSENQLADKFGVSRMTARRALGDLERQGSVERIPGKGTFVRRSEHFTRGFFRVRPFRKWAEDLGAELTTRVLASKIVDPPGPIAAKLETRDPLIYLSILNYLDRRPVRYSVRYLRCEQCAGMLWEDLAQLSVHEILISKYQLPLTKITQTMTAVGLPADLADLFQEPAGYPVFHFQRLVYSLETPLSHVEYTLRGDMAFKDTFTPQIEGTDFNGKKE
ncbi:MAG: GntR family transcriptional regulator [Desulfobacterales bacterium]